MKMNQKEAVFQAIVNVTGFDGEGTVVISKEQRAQVNAILFQGFRAGTITIDRDYSDADLKSYCSGLQSNWLRKDTRLNGGIKYEAKNPGSRAGSTDPQLKALRAVLSNPLPEGVTREEVETMIKTRQAELSKAKIVKTVDFSALPADLAAKFRK